MIPKKVKKQFVHVNVFDKKKAIKKAILKKVRNEKQMLYGARALEIHNPYFSRATEDYDILTKNPKKAAQSMQQELDRVVGHDYFYSQPGMHEGTWKVKSKGKDLKKGTEDDIGFVDYTKFPSPKPKYIKKKGMNVRAVSEEIKAKRNALADPEFAFRHKKDKDDLNRTLSGIKLKKAMQNLMRY